MSPPRLKLGAKLLHHQKDLAIVGSWIVLRLDVDRPDLTRIGAAVQVASGDDVRVIETET
jgi:hypothetical protein